MLAALALIPILLLFILVTVFRRSVASSALSALVVLLLFSGLLWQVSAARAATAAVKGVLLSAEIIAIVFGALFIFYILRLRGYLLPLKVLLAGVSEDARVQSMLVAVSLVTFMEGVAGFGTPALLAVPLLLSLGFPALLAVSIALVGDSVPVIFGAIGLPVTYGIGSALAPGTHEMLDSIVLNMALINIAGSIFVTIVIAAMTTMAFKGKLKDFVSFLPFSIFTALSVSLPALFVARVVGPELPSVIGGMFSLGAIYFAAKHRFLVPKKKILSGGAQKLAKNTNHKSVALAFVPYSIVVGLLLVSRLPFLPAKELLFGVVLKIPSLAGYSLDYAFYPFYSAGTLILFSAILSAALLRLSKKEALSVLMRTVIKVKRPFIALATLLIFVQIFIYTGQNHSGLSSMPIVMAEGVRSLSGRYWLFFSPMVGALGSFVAGSATVSNLLFSSFQQSTALAAGVSPGLALTLQGLGAAAGNMVALHNVVAALAIAGVMGKESQIIRKNLPPLLVYLSLLGLLGLAIGLTLAPQA